MKKLRVEGFDLSQRLLEEWNQAVRRGRKAADPRGEGGGPQDIVCGGETVERRQVAGGGRHRPVQLRAAPRMSPPAPA